MKERKENPGCIEENNIYVIYSIANYRTIYNGSKLCKSDLFYQICTKMYTRKGQCKRNLFYQIYPIMYKRKAFRDTVITRKLALINNVGSCENNFVKPDLITCSQTIYCR